MPIVKILIISIIFLIYPYGYSAGFIKPLDPYKSGPELFEYAKSLDWIKYTLSKEHGHYIELPLDYNNPKAGNISIYYYTLAPIDLAKPTFIFFQGGPGASAHFMNELFEKLSSWNVIQLDYRGIGFSYPTNLEELRNPKYFSSEFVARDAFEIIKSLGISSVSVYGHSYGTMVATIFSSLYPEVVNATVLEGTIFTSNDLWNSSYRRKILQRIFDKLPKETKEKILYYSNLNAYPPWFSVIGQREMYNSNFEKTFIEKINSILFKNSDSEIVDELKEMAKASIFNEDDNFFSTHFFSHIACKEINLRNENANFYFVFNGNNLIDYKSNSGSETCDFLGIKLEDSKPYQSTEYKLSKPVTYFLGGKDGATTAEQGVHHFKFSNTGSAQIFIAPQAGHMPLLGLFNESTETERKIAVTLLNKALLGNYIPLEDFNTIRGHDLQGWVVTSKGFNEIKRP